MFLKEGDIQQFACHINGSYPEATVQVFLGHDDITDLFEVKSSLKSSEGPQGLKPVFYRTDVISKSTVIGYHNMTKMLKCEAKVSASDVFKVASINVNLTECKCNAVRNKIESSPIVKCRKVVENCTN